MDLEMKKPKYMEFGNCLAPVILDGNRGKYVLIVAEHTNGDQVTTGLIAQELRELATYLEHAKNR